MKSENLSSKTIVSKLDLLKKEVITQWNGIFFLLPQNKLIENIPDPRNDKGPHQSFVRKKNTKSVEEPKMFTQELKTFEKPKHYQYKVSDYRASKNFV